MFKNLNVPFLRFAFIGVARGSAARGGSKNCRPQMSNNFLSVNQLQMRSSILHDKICVN